MSGRKYFGTDGIRGRVGEHPITPDFCLKLGRAVGRTLDVKLALIGKDTRISGYMLESVIEAGLVSTGVSVGLLGPTPTPAIAYLTRTLRADVGIVISASHNPYQDNGIKFFDGQGRKLDDRLEAAVEREIEVDSSSVLSADLGKAFRVTDANGRYIEFCKGSLQRGLRLHGLKVVLDCAHGSTYNVAPGVFTELGAEVTVIGNEPEGKNINSGCGSTHPETLQRMVLDTASDIGIAFDGDGDRSIMVDENGRVVDGDEVLFILAQAFKKERRLSGGVVGTTMTNLGFEKALNSMGVSFERSEVGDRNVLERMESLNWNLGGETSGHVICSDLNTTGDGIITALQVVSSMITQESALSDLAKDMSKYPQRLINVEDRNPSQTLRDNELKKLVAEIQKQLGDKGRVIVRPSGTEPLVRIMVEGTDQTDIDNYAEELADMVKTRSS